MAFLAVSPGSVCNVSARDLNSVPELVEFLMRLSGSGEALALKADLRVGAAELTNEDIAFEVKVKRLLLDLELGGLNLKPGTRYGEPEKANVVLTRTSTAVEQTGKRAFKGGVSGKADSALVASASAEGSAELSHQRTETRKYDTKIEHKQLRVKALGNDRWSVAEPDGTELADTYLNNVSLCDLEPVEKANQRVATVRVVADQRDFAFDINRRSLASLSVTKKKMLGILIAKCLSLDPLQYQGKVVLSESEVDHEG
jgi:hypothetical protein